jgi:hypothetical protein
MLRPGYSPWESVLTRKQKQPDRSESVNYSTDRPAFDAENATLEEIIAESRRLKRLLALLADVGKPLPGLESTEPGETE